MFKSVSMLILTVLLAACASANPSSSQPAQAQYEYSSPESSTPVMGTNQPVDDDQPIRANLQDLGPAPELENEVWLNTNQPLSLEGLRGQVVLLDMWTFG